ncbi:hypothetical protein ASG90_06770 [Nocardioides sp. Soil797]|nr:hypothetical protein ASG90_06770 [Nocardioides sp. Soil797]
MGAKGLAAIAPTADGRFLVGVKNERLVRYRIKPDKIREVGRSRPTDLFRLSDQEIVVHPSGRFAYVHVYSYVKRSKSAVIVFRIDRPNPKLVKTIKAKNVHPSKRANLKAMAMRPDGKRLHLIVGRDLVTLRMGNGQRAKVLSVQKDLSVGTPMVTTPDGETLISTLSGQGSPHYASYRKWDISGVGAPVPGPEQRIDLTPFDLEDESGVAAIVIGPDSTTAHVQIREWVEDGFNEAIARVRLADGEITAVLGDPFGRYHLEQLLGRSPSGKRIYGLNRGPGGSEEDGRDPFLARADSALATHKRLKPGRFALETSFAVSPAGRTKGLIYSTQAKDGKRFLVSIRN